MAKKTAKSAAASLGKLPGQSAREGIRSNQKFTGILPDFSGQWRCDTGLFDLGKKRIILIKPHQFEAKREKYPALKKLEIVQ